MKAKKKASGRVYFSPQENVLMKGPGSESRFAPRLGSQLEKER
jgi:hypothetical protein